MSSSSSRSYSKVTSGGSHQQRTTLHHSSESFGNAAGGLLSDGSDFPSLTSHFASNSVGSSNADLEQAQNALKEREAQLDAREAELKKKQEALAEREDALDAAHERLIGAEVEEEEKDDEGKPAPTDPSSAALTDELRKENEALRSELAAAKKEKQKPPRFLTQRFAEEDGAGHDRFKLSERKSGPGGRISMGSGFDPQLMDRWRAGHIMMGPRKPRSDGSERAGGK